MSASLYERLGELDGIKAIVDDAVDAHLASPIVGPRFAVIEDIEHAKQVAAEFFASGAGGPLQYTGRDMLTTHKGMNISEQEFIAVVDDILHALEKNGVDADTRNEVLVILYSLKGEIVRV